MRRMSLSPVIRRSLKLIPFCVAAILFSCADQERGDIRDLKNGFVDPPVTARAKVYWWWLNGYVNSVRLKEELQAIKDAGLGGVDIFEIGVPPNRDPNGIIPAGPAFMSDESLAMIRLAIEEAGKLGLEVGLGVASSWNAGGSWVEPHHAAKTLYASRTRVAGGKDIDLALPFPEITPDRSGRPRQIQYMENGRPAYSEEVAVIAVPAAARHLPDTSSILNITEYFDPVTERLQWNAPEGEWDVFRYVCS